MAQVQLRHDSSLRAGTWARCDPFSRAESDRPSPVDARQQQTSGAADCARPPDWPSGIGVLDGGGGDRLLVSRRGCDSARDTRFLRNACGGCGVLDRSALDRTSGHGRWFGRGGGRLGRRNMESASCFRGCRAAAAGSAIKSRHQLVIFALNYRGLDQFLGL